MSSNNVRVSIIVPACNSEKTIEKCVFSIFNNIHSNIECVIVINNSQDNTSDICRLLKKKYPSIIIINSSANGVSAARNEGIAKSTGSIVGFCDADDYYEPYAIDFVVKQFLLSSADLVITGFNRKRISSDGIVKTRQLKANRSRIISVKIAQSLVLNDPRVFGSVWNKFYKKMIISGIKFNECLTHSEDTHFNMQVLRNQNLKILLTNRVTYNYINSQSSTTGSIDCCYTEDEKLKYLTAFEIIRSEFINDKHVIRESAYSLAALSIDNYQRGLSKKRKENLVYYIRKYYLYLFINILSYNPIRNIKRLIKGGLALLKLI